MGTNLAVAMSKTFSIQISHDTADEIVRQALEQAISLLKDYMKELRRIPKKKLQKFQKEDLQECEELLRALEKTLAYYSPPSE